MKIAPYHSQMRLPTKLVASLRGQERQNQPSDKLASDKLFISMAAIKKSREPTEAEDQLPVHIKQLKARIKQLKKQIEEQQQQLKELEQQTGISSEAKDKTRELYQKQLISLQLELASTIESLEEAIKSAGIEDPTLLVAALFN